jgi:hypothetical protein
LGTPSSGTLTSCTGYKLSALVAATGTNTIDSTSFKQEWQWSTLAVHQQQQQVTHRQY